jgi:DNA-binding GntR family transcriptional regulator
MPKAKSATLRETVHESLKAMIVTGQLPPGSKLAEAELAARLKVSRTPVREALNRLEQDGLVTGRPRYGYVVADFDIKMFREAFELREVLDAYATELAVTRITPDDKALLRGLVRECEELAALPDRSPQDMFQELETGMEIHRAIARISGNEMLSGMLETILDKCQHYVWVELMRLDEWHLARKEHADIVEAVCAGDAPLAVALTREHIRTSRNNTLRLLEAKSSFHAFLAQDGRRPERTSRALAGAKL